MSRLRAAHSRRMRLCQVCMVRLMTGVIHCRGSWRMMAFLRMVLPVPGSPRMTQKPPWRLWTLRMSKWRCWCSSSGVSSSVPPMPEGGLSDQELVRRLGAIYSKAGVGEVAKRLAEVRQAIGEGRADEALRRRKSTSGSPTGCTTWAIS
jgi:hypothetical protein